MTDLLRSDDQIVLVDDGSIPVLLCHWVGVARFTLVRTHDHNPWTQPRARNAGMKQVEHDRVLMLDIDHVLTKEVVDEVRTRDHCHFQRATGSLDGFGRWKPEKRLNTYGPNIMVVSKQRFSAVGGYDEKFCGKHGGDDREFLRRYNRPFKMAKARLGVLSGKPWDHMMHGLRR